MFIFSDRGQFGSTVKIRPSGDLRDEKDVFRPVFVSVFGVCAFVFAFAFDELVIKQFEGIGNVFEENKPKCDMLIFCSVDSGCGLSGPKFTFPALPISLFSLN